MRADAHLLLADTDEQLADADVLVREWRGRLEAYRPSAADPDPTTRTVLAEMFNTGNEVESELLAVELALHDLTPNVHAHFDRPDHDSGVAAAQNLCEQLRANLNRYRGLRDTITRWNAVLVRVAVAHTDPLGSFLAWHEAGDHTRALEAVAHLGVPLADLQHVRRHLDCLAHVGDSTGYEDLLREHAARLGAVPVDAADPAAFLTRARSSVAQVRAPGGTTGAGLVLTKRLVVTNRRMVVRGADGPDSLIDPGDLEVLVDGQVRTADRIVTSPGFSMIALVQLSEPVEAAPLRLGYTSLIRVGNPVYAVELRADGPLALTSGLVQRFESVRIEAVRVLGTRPSPRQICGLASSGETSLGAHPEDKPRSSAAMPSSEAILRRSSSDTGRCPVSIWLRCRCVVPSSPATYVWVCPVAVRCASTTDPASSTTASPSRRNQPLSASVITAAIPPGFDRPRNVTQGNGIR